jgi:hypothetical protein
MSHNSVTYKANQMANKNDLINRKGIWYFNKAFPQPLWTITGKAPFRRSLRTASLQEAKRAKPDAERLYWAAVDAAKGQIGSSQPRRFTELEAMGLVAQWFNAEDAERLEAVVTSHSPLMDIDAALRELDGLEAETRQAIAEGDLNTVLPLAERLASEAGLEFDPKAKPSKAFMLVLLRGRRELLILERARVLGDYAATPTDPTIRRALEVAPAAPKVRTIDNLIDGFKADNMDKWSPATIKAVEAPLHVLREFYGASRDVATITRDDGRALFALVQGIPTNMTKLKALRGLSVREAVAKSADLGLPTLSPKTINETYLAFMGSAFRWGVSEGWLSVNPLERLSVVETVDDADKRSPFTTAQLNILFHSGPWQGPRRAGEGDPLRHWGPLVALFQGMRRGEIAQLDVADVVTGGDIPAIHVQPSKDGKRVKSAAGRRVLPIHSELIRLGFLSFVESQRQAGHSQLFPDEKPTTAGHWGDLLGKWFAGHLKASGIKGVKLGMHSFRHNFEDALRAANLHGTPIGQELAGRAKADKVSGGYGEGRYALETLKPAVEAVRYPVVDLSHLYVESL